MLIGPVFTRELVLAPRRTRFYLARAGYVAALLVLAWTAWLVLTGTQLVRDVGDLARFGNALFQIIAPLQLALAMFFSALLTAGAVAQEKDRRTLILLLLTNLRNSELVLGKLLASLLSVLVMLAAAWPLFMLAALLGGIAYGQILRVFCVTLGTVLACGSLGSTIALWREKTFQALALTLMTLVLWVTLWSVVGAGLLGPGWLGVAAADWAAAMSPWHAVQAASRPQVGTPDVASLFGPWGGATGAFLLTAATITIVLNGVAVFRIRAWNGAETARPRREPIRPLRDAALRETILGSTDAEPSSPSAGTSTTTNRDAETVTRAGATAETGAGAKAAFPPGRTRRVWDNPVIWREMRTWAYGRKVILIRLIYLIFAGMAAAGMYQAINMVPPSPVGLMAAVVPLMLLSLVLVNAQAVTSLTTERDGRALDLLLVTDLTPKEIVYGKLGGVFYNTKEMFLVPIALCVYLLLAGAIDAEGALLLLVVLAVLYVFVAMLGIHAGMSYTSSRWAISTSIGTVFFLFFGIATCIWMMVVFSGSFQAQFGPFFTFMIGGGVGLYVALGIRNPSAAIGVASFACPFATFYAITSFMLGSYIAAALAMVFAYGFTTVALLIPAVDEFDVVTGRTTAD